MKAVIIAAGMGNRLRDLTSDRPKGMVRVNDRELILRVKDFLSSGPFSEYIVVTGYRADDFSGFLARRWPEARVLVNDDYTAGSIRTIACALPHLDTGFLLMNADHIYPRRMLPTVIEHRTGITAMCDFDRNLGDDDMKVKLDGQGRLTEISKTLEVFDGGYIGMTCCGSDAVAEYRDAVERTLAARGAAANVEAILGQLAADGIPVRTGNASGFGWLEVDTVEDLEHAASVLHNDPGYLA